MVGTPENAVPERAVEASQRMPLTPDKMVLFGLDPRFFFRNQESHFDFSHLNTSIGQWICWIVEESESGGGGKEEGGETSCSVEKA